MQLTPSEVSTFRAVKKCAIVLLLMLRLDKPTGAQEVADILDMNYETVSGKLRSLAQLGVITRTSYHNGYILTGAGGQLVLGALAEIPRVAPITTTINTLTESD